MTDLKAVSRTERYIYFLAILVLLGMVAHAYYYRKNEQTQNEILSQQTKILQEELLQVNREIKIKETEIDQIIHSKNVQLKKKQRQLEREVKKLKAQRKVIRQHLTEIGVLKQEKGADTEKMLRLNKELVVLRNRLQDIRTSTPQIIQNKIDSVKETDSTRFAQVMAKNRQLQRQLHKEKQQQSYLNKRIEVLEEIKNQLSSPLLRIEVATDASKLRYSKFTRYIHLNFTILPNPAKKRQNKLIKVYHLLYKYQDKKTQMKRRLVTTIAYHKERRLTKAVKYNNRKAFEKGTHVFEAEVDGLILASKTVDVE